MDRVCFVIPSVGKKAYQDLAKTHSAIETFLSIVSNGCSCKRLHISSYIRL